MDWQNLTISLICPVILIVFGFLTRFGLPKRVNWFIGYRTSMACKNQDTWVFAHKHAGKLWIWVGFILVIVTAGVALFVERSTCSSEIILRILMMTQIVGTLLSLIPTEIALRKAFDKNGERRY